MNDTKTLNRSLETMAWGGIFIWWGVTELIQSIPDGIGALGIGLILLALNAIRAMTGIPTSAFSITLGILALVWGGLELVDAVLQLPFEMPVFEILLITLGMLLLGRELLQIRNTQRRLT